MSQFIAIPVSVGDAFYLNRNDYSILIDGGLDGAGFPGLFRATTKNDSVNVVVCTHNDADHANGIIGFLKAGLSCDEVWLPGSWLGVLPDILGSVEMVLAELAKNILDDRRQHDDSNSNYGAPSLEAYIAGRRRLSEQNVDKGEVIVLSDDGWAAQLVELLETSAPWDSVSLQHWIVHLIYPSVIHNLDEAEIQLLWSAIDAASRIRTIAQEAFHRGIPVRWFEYDTRHPSGGNNHLQPLNAREIAKIRVRATGRTLLYLLSLSVSNKESLVFWSPPMGQERGVLFNADSDLANVTLPSNSDLLGALATAPHHGSEANANAYVAMTRAAPSAYRSIIWIRSDGRSKKRPGASYLGLGRSTRACTICRVSTEQFTKKYAVVAQTTNSGVWQVQSAQCTCC